MCLRWTVVADIAEIRLPAGSSSSITLGPSAAYAMSWRPNHLRVMTNLTEVVFSMRSVLENLVLQVPGFNGKEPENFKFNFDIKKTFFNSLNKK